MTSLLVLTVKSRLNVDSIGPRDTGFNRQGDLKPFKSFVMAETIKTWRKLATELAENAQ